MRTARVGGWLIGLAAFTTSGCSNKGSPSAEESEELVTSLSEIAGTWDIASFDGYTPERLGAGVRQAYVNVSRDHLGYAIGCNSSGNAAHILQQSCPAPWKRRIVGHSNGRASRR